MVTFGLDLVKMQFKMLKCDRNTGKFVDLKQNTCASALEITIETIAFNRDVIPLLSILETFAFLSVANFRRQNFMKIKQQAGKALDLVEHHIWIICTDLVHENPTMHCSNTFGFKLQAQITKMYVFF